MPPISEMTGIDLEALGYKRVTPSTPPADFQPERSLLPARDPTLRFSAPFIPGSFPSSDTLRGYHIGSVIPQYRIAIPPAATAQGGGGSTTTTNTVIVNSSSSTTTNNPPVEQTTSFATPVLNPGDQYTGVVTMAKSFVVLQVAVNSPVRLRLYSTSVAQISDLSRPSTQAPGLGTNQGIIGDIYLDTAPVVWQAVNMVGANGDSPQSTTIYVTCDNIGLSSGVVNIGISFVPIQS